MKRFLPLIVMGSLTMAHVTAASADDLALTVQGGTTGLGAGLAYQLSEQLNVRGSYNGFEYNHDETVDELNTIWTWNCRRPSYCSTGIPSAAVFV